MRLNDPESVAAFHRAMLAGVPGENDPDADAQKPRHVIDTNRSSFVQNDHRLRGEIASALTQQRFQRVLRFLTRRELMAGLRVAIPAQRMKLFAGDVATQSQPLRTPTDPPARSQLTRRVVIILREVFIEVTLRGILATTPPPERRLRKLAVSG